MIFAFDLVELAVFDENSCGFAEQLFEGFNHLTWSAQRLNDSLSLYPLKVAVYGLYAESYWVKFNLISKNTANNEILEFRVSERRTALHNKASQRM